MSIFRKLSTIIALIVAVAMVVTVFAGCAQEVTPAEESAEEAPAEEPAGEEPAEEPAGEPAEEEPASDLAGTQITVIFPKHEMDTVGIFEQQTREFTELTGIEVELIQAEWDRVKDKVIPEMAASGSAYDVIELDNSWVTQFVNADWVVPLNEYASEEWISGLAEGAVGIFSVQDDLYGIPWNHDIRFFIYNRQMLDDAGIAEPPRTFDEMIEQSKTIMDAGLAEYGIAGFWSRGMHLSNATHGNVWAHGGNFFNEEGNPTFLEDPAVAEGLDYMYNILNVDEIADPASLTYVQEDSMNVFISGRTAFFPQAWPGLVSESNNPDSSAIVGQVEVASWVLGKTEETQATMSLPEALAIPKTSQNKEAAWEYIKFITGKEKDKERSLEIGSLPVWTESFGDEELTEIYPYWSNLQDVLPYARAYPRIDWVGEWVNSVEIQVQSVLTDEKTTEQALEDLNAEIQGNLQ
ncbi:MAG: sugar ABC transporter substrate-binding protein [Actinomycetia bacterium]|nr:sugar ABC transporter substrate-binding protein [Actinomycetes bacterium]